MLPCDVGTGAVRERCTGSVVGLWARVGMIAKRPEEIRCIRVGGRMDSGSRIPTFRGSRRSSIGVAMFSRMCVDFGLLESYGCKMQ